MTKFLTAKQRFVLETIIKLIRQQGFAPTLGQLAAELGVSTPTAHQHVGALEKKGYLTRERRHARTMRVVWGGELPLRRRRPPTTTAAGAEVRPHEDGPGRAMLRRRPGPLRRLAALVGCASPSRVALLRVSLRCSNPRDGTFLPVVPINCEKLRSNPLTFSDPPRNLVLLHRSRMTRVTCTNNRTDAAEAFSLAR